MVTFSAPRSPLSSVTSNISCRVGAVRRSVQIQVARRHHHSAHQAWSSEDTLLLSVSLTLLLLLIIIITAFIVLLLRRFQTPSSPRPVFTGTMEPGADVSHVSLQPRSTNVSFIDLYNPPQDTREPELETKSLRTFRETHFELGLSPPPAYSDSIMTNQRPVSELWTNQRPGHTMFHCQHSCFTRPHLDCS